MDNKNTRSCFTCAKFTNSRAELCCGDLNTPITKGIDIRKGCDSWEQKGNTNWYMIFDGCKHIKHELTRDEEDDILNEYYRQNGDSADHMPKERYELVQYIKWRRVLQF